MSHQQLVLFPCTALPIMRTCIGADARTLTVLARLVCMTVRPRFRWVLACCCISFCIYKVKRNVRLWAFAQKLM